MLGGGPLTGLGAVRSLGRAGVNVYYVDEWKNATAYSKYCKKYFIFPKIGHDKEELRRVLLKLKYQTGDAVLFPGSDSYILYLSDLMDELSSYYVSAPKKEVIEILVNKRRFYESLMKEKAPYPTTYFSENLEDVRKMSKEISYPIYIKPYISQFFSERFSKKGFVANSERELLRYFELMMKSGINIMIQEIVPGPPTNHIFLDGYIDRNYNFKALFARRRLRMWPLAFGESTLCVSIPISEIPPLKELLFRYLKSINYRGIFSAEFKRDQRNGVLKLLEINSRTSAWFNTLCAKCGINITFIAYLDAIGRETEYSEDYEAGIKLIFKDDLISSMIMFMNGDLGIREWVSSLLGKKDFASYAKDDLRPFIVSLAYDIRNIINLGERVRVQNLNWLKLKVGGFPCPP